MLNVWIRLNPCIAHVEALSDLGREIPCKPPSPIRVLGRKLEITEEIGGRKTFQLADLVRMVRIPAMPISIPG